MTLHEAIELVLKENKRPMSAKDIADEINNRNLYQRGDGNPVPTSQIHARVKNYPLLFKKTLAREIALLSPPGEATSTTKTTPLPETERVKPSITKYENTLTLENFRTYKNRTSIALAPVTILTGKNNAGKSTIFKSQILLSDYLNSDNQLILEFDGLSAHKHKIDCIDNALSWGSGNKSFTIEYNKDGYGFTFTFDKNKNQGVLGNLLIMHEKSGYMLSMRRLSQYRFSLHLDIEFIDTYFKPEPTKEDIEMIALDEILNKLKKERSEINKHILNIDKAFQGSPMYINLLEKKKTINERLKNTRFQIANLSEGSQKKEFESKYQIGVEIDLSDEIETPDFKIASIIRRSLLNIFNSENFRKEFGTSDKNKDRFKLFRFTDYLTRAMMFNVYHLGPNRTHQARLYINRNRENEINEIMNFYAHNEPAKGSKVDRFLKNWMQEFDIGEEIEVVPVQATASYIVITDNGKKQNLTDKGFGAGQVLTMLLKIVNEVQKSKPSRHTNRFQRIALPTIIIEEPETNLHPEFQSKLAEMFYDAHKLFGIRFILETHSEYLIRKTQSLINKTNDQGVFKIYYVDKTKGIYEMRYREDGKFIDEFGSGFFDESTNLTLDLF